MYQNTFIFLTVHDTCLLNIYFHQVSALPEIVGDILPDIKKEGETAYLNCTVANKGYDTVVSKQF